MTALLTRAAKRAKLRQIIEERIASAPHERGGLLWAAIPQPKLAAAVGVSERTIYDWTGKAPYQREVALVNGVKLAVVRVLPEGEAVTPTPTHIANKMRKMIQEDHPELAKRFTGTQHACLIWLARLWPEGSQLDILRHCLKHWEDFVTAAKHLLECEAEQNGTIVMKRYLAFPNIQFIRRAYAAGPCSYAMSLQSAEKAVPAPVMDVYLATDCFG